MSNNNKKQLVIIAAKNEESLRDDIESQLTHVNVAVWHTGKIQAGDMRKSVIADKLQKADILVPLLSADFWSDKSRRNELQGFIMPIVRKLKAEKDIKITPILAKPYSWEMTEFKDFQILPSSGKPIATGSKRYDDLTEIALTLSQIATNSNISQNDIDLTPIIEEQKETMTNNKLQNTSANTEKPSVFIVHGHNDTMKGQVQLLVERLGLKSVVLHEQTNSGKTIIEKFEEYANKAAFAIIILSADDLGYAKANKKAKKLRARQNVVFELGFFTGHLGRKKVAVLQETSTNFESVGDYSGVVYVPYQSGEWKVKLAREMKAAGLPVDLNKQF